MLLEWHKNQFIAKILRYKVQCRSSAVIVPLFYHSLTTYSFHHPPFSPSIPLSPPIVFVQRGMLVFACTVSLLLRNNSIFNNEHAFINFRPRSYPPVPRHTLGTFLRISDDGPASAFAFLWASSATLSTTLFSVFWNEEKTNIKPAPRNMRQTWAVRRAFADGWKIHN